MIIWSSMHNPYRNNSAVQTLITLPSPGPYAHQGWLIVPNVRMRRPRYPQANNRHMANKKIMKINVPHLSLICNRLEVFWKIIFSAHTSTPSQGPFAPLF